MSVSTIKPNTIVSVNALIGFLITKSLPLLDIPTASINRTAFDPPSGICHKMDFNYFYLLLWLSQTIDSE